MYSITLAGSTCLITGAGATYSMTGESEAVAAWVTASGETNSVTCPDATHSFTGTGAACTAVAEVYTGGAEARRTVSGFVFGLVNAFNSSATLPRKDALCRRLTCRRKAAAVSKARRRRESLRLPHPRFSSVLRRARGLRCGFQAHQQVGVVSHHGTPERVHKHHSLRQVST